MLVTFGVNNIENDRVDHAFARKLRVLCGRRKKNITLLGGSWSEELDGGDPLVVRKTDRQTYLNMLNTVYICTIAVCNIVLFTE